MDQDKFIPIPQHLMQIDDGLLFLPAKIPSLDIRPQIIRPPEPATLPTPQQPYKKKAPALESVQTVLHQIHNHTAV